VKNALAFGTAISSVFPEQDWFFQNVKLLL
jgi:hypothetical protein